MATETATYRRRARLLAVRLLILPGVLAAGVIVIWFGGDYGILTRLGAGTLVSLASGFGLPVLLGELGRDAGKAKEPRLFASWGGTPTTQMLRHRDTLFNPIIRDRCHAKLRILLADVHIPTAEEEALDPRRADAAYEACTRFLIGQTRDAARFPLIFEENVNYGFRRNLWGMRPAGIVISAVGTATAFYATAAAYAAQDPLWLLGAGVVLVNACFLAWWLVRITSGWVKVPARAYAERLFEACDCL